MAFLGHLGPLPILRPVDRNSRSIRSIGQLGPFCPNPMRPKGARGGSHLYPKPQVDPTEPILATNPLDPNLAKNPLDTKMAIEPVGPKFGHRPSGTTFQRLASGNPQRPPGQLSQPFPQLKGNSFHSSMHPILKVAGVVHVWYYIPLCTIFAQQFNDDAVRAKFHNLNSRSQNPTPI
ncbi:hypothetical protein O181_099507 [Austropuccinia psidii MF-1]|uniref:Uncharacterized protein n=1 Tax=Austropuccinia psidii MF-1 TaxID=1389203 RepID=A0A9Q3PGL2_9BASI|nr:hypothetical protein [Austropuccinia psidii MF-1]